MPDPHNLHGGYSVSPDAFVAGNAYLDRSGGLVIEGGVIVSEHVRIETHEHDMTPGYRGDESRIAHSPLTICTGAFIGYGAIVLNSCTRIGEHAVVGAGAVVTHDVGDREVVGGVPARLIRTL